MNENDRIVRIEWGRLEGRRPRHAGSNARLGEHGIAIGVPIARLTTGDGASGFGICHARADRAAALLGCPILDLFSPTVGVPESWRAFEYPLWDLAGARAGQPVYAVTAAMSGAAAADPFTAPCYDTSLYFDDLHLASDAEAAALIAREASEGLERGHRSFKIKVGRGARHMALEEGTRRDVALVEAVRETAGPEAEILLDANNGYNLNLTKRVLDETAANRIHWIEEPFHEDAVLYRDLKEWMAGRGLAVRIADGEGQASPSLMDWARDGIVDVVQYDIFGHGFTRWLETGHMLDAWSAGSAPHHYGGHYGNYAACHLAGAIRGFAFVEWDEATVDGLDTSGYSIREGRVHVPAAPGFGLGLDEAEFARAVASGGYDLSV